MYKRRNKQKGFSILEVLAAVCIIVLFAAIGWAVYQQNRTKPGGAAPGTGQSLDQAPAVPEPQPAVAYMEIKEWGVKFPLAASIKDAYYTMQGSNVGDDDLPNTAWLGLKSLDSRGCHIAGTGPSSTATPIGSIIRVLPTQTDPVAGIPYPKRYPNGITVDGYYYAYLEWKNKSCAPEATLHAVDAAFAGAAKAAVRSRTAGN